MKELKNKLNELKEKQEFYKPIEFFEILNFENYKNYLVIFQNVKNGEIHRGNYKYLKGFFKHFKIRILKFECDEYTINKFDAPEYFAKYIEKDTLNVLHCYIEIKELN